MQNDLNELDFSDLNTKDIQNQINSQRFSEIDIKKGNCGIVKLI